MARNVRESILDLNKHVDKKVRVRFQGGREVEGILKGYDPLVNIVLDDTEEFLTDKDNNVTDKSRKLGLTVCRGTSVMLICPVEGMKQIDNPFQ